MGVRGVSVDDASSAQKPVSSLQPWSHRASFSSREVAALVKVRPAPMQLEIEAGTLHASKVGRVYRITPQDLHVWLECKRPGRRRDAQHT